MQYSQLWSSTYDAALIAGFVAINLVVLAPRYDASDKLWLFVFGNAFAVFALSFRWPVPHYREFALMIAVLLGHWLLIHLFNRSGNSNDRLYWLAFLSPFALLIVVRSQSTLLLVAAACMAFRMAQTAFDMRRDPALRTTLPEYLAFLLFLPTFATGPISPLRYFKDTCDGSSISLRNTGIGLLRIMVGFIKLRLLATLAYELTFTVLWRDGFQHDWIDFIISGGSFYLYIYLTFSGISDIAIGAAAMIGIRVKENFNNPLLARNVIDFWRRWHISLTDFVRDAVLAPLSTALTGTFGPRYATPAALLAILASFGVLLFWHGFGLGICMFYALHALAFAANQLWDNALRRRGEAARQRYLDQPIIRIVSTAATLLFLAVTYALLDLGNWPQMERAWLSLR